MTNPAMAVYHQNLGYQFYYMSTVESKLRSGTALVSELLQVDSTVDQDIKDESINSSIIRFNRIADFFLSYLKMHNTTKVYLEGYALGARGKVFSIAENTAILKQRLWEANIEVGIIPPTVVKKHATDKGNASKDDMKAAFEGTEDVHLLEEISHYKHSPYTDCIDAYWTLRCGLDITH